MTKNNRTPLLIMTCAFLLLTVVFVLIHFFFNKNEPNLGVVVSGNVILFALGLYTIYRSLGAINHPNPHVFVRRFYAGFLIRLLVCATAAFIYIYVNDGKVNKASLFICLGTYALYSMIEVNTLRKALNQKKNA